MKPFQAIAAMSLNRVIGHGNQIPWHLPEDFQWFKQMTTGHLIVMGRKTYESIGRPLPNRTTVVLSRNPTLAIAGVRVIAHWDQIQPECAGQTIFICGGAQIYEQALPFCSDLYLTVVKRQVEGDAFFPRFEDRFAPGETLVDKTDYAIQHYAARPEPKCFQPAAPQPEGLP